MTLGRVLALWRYPVKSMQGERVEAGELSERGMVGDRALALQDVETGKVASAKSPRMWPSLLEFHAAFVEPPRAEAPLPPVQITFPDGKQVRSDDPDVEDALSRALGRRVRLIRENPKGATYDYYVAPDSGGPPEQTGSYLDIPNDLLGAGGLYDVSPIHLLTTASLDRLQELYPQGRIEVARFRPNLVVEAEGAGGGFVENEWVSKELRIGKTRLQIAFPTSRCVMTTLAQGDLPQDAGVLRSLAVHNRQELPSLGALPCLGVAGMVRQRGRARLGDPVEAPG